MLKQYISPNRTVPNYRRLNSDGKLVVCLYYLNDTGPMWMTENTFGINRITVSKVVVEVYGVIAIKLGPSCTCQELKMK